MLIIGWGWPEPNATAAGTRMLQLITYFKNREYQITFVATAVKNVNANHLDNLGVQTQQVFLNCDSFDEFITRLQPGIVLFDRFLAEEQFGWRVAEQVPKALRVLDTEDLHSLRHVRENCFKAGKGFSTESWLQDEKTKREIASIFRCDLSLIISTYEIELLLPVLGNNKNLLYHLPFMVNESDVLLDSPSFEERTDFMFIGGGKHSPNIDAIKHLKTDLWPLIRERLPNINLHIYGAYLPQQIMELHNESDGFHVLGKALDVQEVMKKAKVCLAPLRYGAGIKGKLLHAMQFGTPSVTTGIGAEGMHGKMEWNGAITLDNTEFVNAAVALYTNKTKWSKAQKNGYAIINTKYNKVLLEKQLDAKINSTCATLTVHRNQNFVGSLLMQQTMASTKYMSRWIQEKNKNI